MMHVGFELFRFGQVYVHDMVFFVAHVGSVRSVAVSERDPVRPTAIVRTGRINGLTWMSR